MLNLPIKKYLIIGSYALGVRPAADIDVVCYEADVECEYKRLDDYTGTFQHNGKKVELLFADKQESLQYLLTKDNGYPYRIATYIELFAIKAAHIAYPHRQWEKHIMDYHILRNMINYNHFDQSVNNLIDLHKKATKERLGKQRLPSLNNTTKEQFFDDAVTKHYIHDDIHQWFAHREKPMYTYMQEDPKLVDCSKQLWEGFPFTNKLKCVMEECYVIASERHLIPQIKRKDIRRPGSKDLNPNDAFKWALMRVCTTLTSGWFRQFAIDNYFNVLNNYNRNYTDILTKNM